MPKKWCHGKNDFLQIDHKSMFEYSDPGSAQNRFCGTGLPNFGGIANNHQYTSESNQLVLWFKSNSDSDVGTGFELNWSGYDCPTDKPNLDQTETCVATCPDFNDQGTCVTTCPTGRVIIAAEKTCVTTCPDQGACVTNCPPDTEPSNVLLDQTTCVAICPTARPNNDQTTCVADCPTARPDDNNDMICGD